MKVSDLREAVGKLYIFDELLVIGKHGDDSQTSLIKENGNWIVYTYERNKRHALKTFKNEDDACRFVLDMMRRVEDTNFNYKGERIRIPGKTPRPGLEMHRKIP